jgi:hypothetical protein
MVRRVIRGSSRAGRSDVFDPDSTLLRLRSREARVVVLTSLRPKPLLPIVEMGRKALTCLLRARKICNAGR